MIRNRSISTILALLIMSAMTLVDTRSWVFEIDELIEGTEIENEELKEGSKTEREWLKLLGSSGSDFIYSELLRFQSGALQIINDVGTVHQALPLVCSIPLFILYCSLKLHIG